MLFVLTFEYHADVLQLSILPEENIVMVGKDEIIPENICMKRK